jgi:hypothetical protein
MLIVSELKGVAVIGEFTRQELCCAYGVVIVIKFIQNFNLKAKYIDSVKYIFLGMEKLT